MRERAKGSRNERGVDRRGKIRDISRKMRITRYAVAATEEGI